MKGTMVDALSVFLIMSKELQDARRSRWFLLLAVVFAGLALALALLGMSALGTIGGAGFGRHHGQPAQSGHPHRPAHGSADERLSVAGEREHGTLLTMLAQPVLLEEVFLGKFLGLGRRAPGHDFLRLRSGGAGDRPSRRLAPARRLPGPWSATRRSSGSATSAWGS